MRRKVGWEMENMGSRREIIVYVDKELTKKRKKKLQKRKSGQTSLLSVALPEFS